MSYLDTHANTDTNQSPFNVISTLNTSKYALPSAVRDLFCLLFIDRLVVLQRAQVSKLLLSASKVQELSVRCLEESPSKRDEDAHYPELDCAGEHNADRVCQNIQNGIDV